MNISPVKNYNLSFCANNVNYLRSTIDGRRKYACCYTRMFRSDLDWNLLSYYLENKYKNAQKVNVLNAACSDGSEPYSLAMILDKKISGGKKFFPIKMKKPLFLLESEAFIIFRGAVHPKTFLKIKSI